MSELTLTLTRDLQYWLLKILSLPPPRTPPIASAFGDTDGEFFDRKDFRPKIFRSKDFLAKFVFVRKLFRPKKFSAENFAVRIAEGGSNGGGPGGAEAPPRSVRPHERPSQVSPSVGPEIGSVHKTFLSNLLTTPKHA